jgi:branched-subunit amino acid transport protein AzlD
MFVIIVLIAVVLAIVWIYQFTFLMALQEPVFVGKYDKALWCAAFICIPPLTPFAFIMWRSIKLGASK